MSDEKGCHCNDVTESNFRKCKIIAKEKVRHACTFLFSLSSGCTFYQQNKIKIKKKEIFSKENLHCFDNQVLSSQLINDLVLDCEHDEPLLHSIYRNLTMDPCLFPNYIPCRKGHSQCFTIVETCVYRLNNQNHLIPCRTGEHIQQCAQFDCNLMFKCQGYYCTPLSYVCDGKWDCPHGYHELFSVCGTSRLCKHMYRCRNSQICVHIEDTCNGFLDCPENDDEHLCELVATKCPIKCLCHILIVQCVNVTLIGGDITQILPHILVKLSHTGLFSLWFVGYFAHASYLYFSHNFINNFCDSFSYNDNIKFIDGGYNIISKLHKHCIYTMLLLETLYLDNNLIDRIHNKALVNLPNLKVFTLGNNFLRSIQSDMFLHLSKLLIFSFINNPLSLKHGTFKNARIVHVISNNYHVCCIVPLTISCNATQPWYISCSTLLPTFSIRLLLFIVVCLILFLNCVSLILHLKTNICAFHLIIISINSTDMLYGLYLMMLLIVDAIFQDSFIADESKWRESITCSVMFTLSLMFSIQSPLTISLMTLSRTFLLFHLSHQ